jgi:nicotinate-nucleotide pyrophosphorylase
MLHFVHADAWVYAQIAQGVVKAFHVLRQLEWNAIECAGGVEHRVAIDETTIPYRNSCLRLREQFSV